MKNTRGRSMGHSAVPRLLDRLAETDAAALLELLDRLPDERMYTLLLLRHGFAMSWPAIRSAAERRGMYYCERHLFRLYARALAETAALLEAAHES